MINEQNENCHTVLEFQKTGQQKYILCVTGTDRCDVMDIEPGAGANLPYLLLDFRLTQLSTKGSNG